MLRLSTLDHVVLTVADINKSVQFYQQVLGMEVETFGSEGRTALKFGEQKLISTRPKRPSAHMPNTRRRVAPIYALSRLNRCKKWFFGLLDAVLR